MFISGDGYGLVSYRSPSEIRRDMERILDLIRESERMLNVRDLIAGAITDSCASDPAAWIPVLEDIVETAGDTMRRIERLEESLDELTEELREVSAAMSPAGRRA